MKNETTPTPTEREISTQILKDLGINYPSGPTFPTGNTFDLPVSIVPRGNVTILLCKTDDAFNTIANHGGVRRARQVREVSGAKYLTVPTSRLVSIFESIARMRVLCSGDKATRRAHQKLAPMMARAWIAALPVESDSYYVKEIAADSIMAEVEA